MKLAHAIAITLGITACSKSGVDGALDKMDGFKSKVCACKDQACIDGVKKEMESWMEKAEKDMKDAKPSEAQEKRGEKIFTEMSACEDKIQGAAGKAEGEKAVASMTALSDEMCKCKDAACADAVNAKFTKWGEEMSKSMSSSSAKPDEAMISKITDITKQYSDCMTKAMMPADAPPAP